jgi:hypothetical protein
VANAINIFSWGRFLIYRELSAILDAQLFPPFRDQIVGLKSHEKGAELFVSSVDCKREFSSQLPLCTRNLPLSVFIPLKSVCTMVFLSLLNAMITKVLFQSLENC